MIESNQILILIGWYLTGVTVKKYTAAIHGISKGCKIYEMLFNNEVNIVGFVRVILLKK